MPKQKPELPQGTLDILVLKALSLGPMHGYGVGQRIGHLAVEEANWAHLRLAIGKVMQTA